jgi:ABC-2 type transport system permease protein
MVDESGILKVLREGGRVGQVSLWWKVYAFMMRDLRNWLTYRLWLMLDVAGTLFNVAAYFFFSKIATAAMLADAGYVGGYFTFAVVGIAFQEYVSFSFNGVIRSIRDEQVRGTMESVLSATTVATFLTGSSAFRFIESTVFLLAAMAVGVGLGAVFTGDPSSLLSVVVILGLLVASHLPIGILGAALSMKTKLGDPVAQIFSWLTQLLSGILYPLNIIPPWLRPFTLFTPLTYSLDAARRCLINGENLLHPAVYWNVFYLLLYVMVSLPISLYAFGRSFESVRRDGELGHY